MTVLFFIVGLSILTGCRAIGRQDKGINEEERVLFSLLERKAADFRPSVSGDSLSYTGPERVCRILLDTIFGQINPHNTREFLKGTISESLIEQVIELNSVYGITIQKDKIVNDRIVPTDSVGIFNFNIYLGSGRIQLKDTMNCNAIKLYRPAIDTATGIAVAPYMENYILVFAIMRKTMNWVTEKEISSSIP